MLLALAGSVVIAAGDRGGWLSYIRSGTLLAITGAMATSVYTLIGRSERKHMSTTAYTFLVYTSAAVTLLLSALLSGAPLTGYPPTDYLRIFSMTVCCTMLGHSVYSWALKYISAAFISTAKLGEPIFATLLGVLIISEIPKLNQIIGGIIVIFGILIYLFAKESTDS